jgi:predicted aldo/keto reductase-like oxidoreductase
MNRRVFLGSGLAAAGATALGACLRGKEDRAAGAPLRRRRKYPIVTRTLGRTGIEIPIISMGGVAEDKAVYVAALEAGLTYIDTDALYLRGKHEELVGEAIKGRPRKSLVVATRVSAPCDPRTGLYRKGTSGEALWRSFDASLKRLGVGFLDILSLHSVSAVGAATFGPFLETLQQIKRSGGARFIGISVHGYEPEIMRAAVDCGVYDVILVSYNFKQEIAAEIKRAIARAAGAGLGIMAMKTQAGAFLDRERTRPVNHKAAIKWVLSDTNVHTAIPGFRNIEEMEMYLSVMADLTLTPQEQADLDAARRQAGLYCQLCGRCLPQCPHTVPVPAYMRAFMYAYGYGRPERAKETMAPHAMGDLACRDCVSCRVSCAMGFDVRDRILDMARLRDGSGGSGRGARSIFSMEALE